jgi:predicted amidophosphoribosyltransferase
MRFPAMVLQNQYARVVGLVYHKSLSKRGGKLAPNLFPPIFDTTDMRPHSFVSTWLSGPLEVLFPRECLVCTRPLRGRSLCLRCNPTPISLAQPRCVRCFGDLASPSTSPCMACETFPLGSRSVRYIWEYEGVARDFIRAMKYHHIPYLAFLAGEVVARELPLLFGERSWDVIVPIPSSPRMLKQRLFQPCLEMSRAIQKNLSGVTIRHGLRHRTNRTPQARRTHQERLQGIRSLFKVHGARHLRGARVLLVEDVITTGATVEAACDALLRAGVLSVDVVALAQARVWRRFRSRIFSLFHSTNLSAREPSTRDDTSQPIKHT